VKRRYDSTQRRAAADETTQRIVAATEALLTEGPIPDVTLNAIADRAGITVQTVLRHMGSRDGCFAAVWERVRLRVDAQRGVSPPGDVGAAITGLLDHYEAEGALVWNLVAQAGSEPVAQDPVAYGRAYHRAWVERCFGGLLPPGDHVGVDALIVATDLSVWRLLRHDLGRSREETAAVITRTVHAIVGRP
jgi:AcrR family transcriptional regulator